jgi:hypothetical protein
MNLQPVNWSLPIQGRHFRSLMHLGAKSVRTTMPREGLEQSRYYRFCDQIHEQHGATLTGASQRGFKDSSPPKGALMR